MRVYVRNPQIEDAEAFIEGSRRSLSLHRPWVYPSTTMSGFLDYLGRCNTDRHEGLLIFRRNDDALLGVINLNEVIRGALQSAFVGYWAFEGHEGRGYMSEGLALTFDHAFGVMGLHRLEINIQPSNTRSLKLVERLGLRSEGFSPKYLKIGGEWRDHERWVIMEEEWTHRGGAATVVEQLSQDRRLLSPSSSAGNKAI